MLLSEWEDGTRILRLETAEEVDEWRSDFVAAYPVVFAGPPYHELITPEEAGAVYDRLTSRPQHISLLAVAPDHTVMGFGIAIPLLEMPSVARELHGLVPAGNTYYLAELGVLNRYRGRGVGRELVRERLRLIGGTRFEGAVLRVSESQNTSKAMYEAMGFEDMGVYMQVSARRTDGRVTEDRRLFLHCILSQVAADRSVDGHSSSDSELE